MNEYANFGFAKNHTRRQVEHVMYLSPRKHYSLLPKVDKVKLIAHQSNAAVIGVTETWLDDSLENSEVSLPNYGIHRRDRNRNGGGVCLYIRHDLSFNPRPYLRERLEVNPKYLDEHR